MVCPMGIDIAELVKEARHGMFKAGLIPERLALMDRTAQQWGSPATPAEDLPDILAEVSEEHGVTIPCDLPQADILVTAAPAELGDHTKALADCGQDPEPHRREVDHAPGRLRRVEHRLQQRRPASCRSG